MGPGPGHQHALAVEVACPPVGMKTHSQRLATGSQTGVRGLTERMALGCLDHDLVAIHALTVGHAQGRAHKFHVEANAGDCPPRQYWHSPQGWLGLMAQTSPTARCSTPSPTAKMRPRRLVAHDDRFADPDRTEAAILVIMQVGAADAAMADGQQDLARTGGRNALQLDADIPFFIKAADANGCSPWLISPNNDGNQVGQSRNIGQPQAAPECW